MQFTLLIVLALVGQDDWPKRKAAFIKALDGDAAARRSAVRTIGEADRVEAVELLVRAWTESERRVRNADEKHPADLDAERRLRSDITLTIGSFTDAVAMRYLASLIRDASSEELRETIAAAAWRLGGPAMADQIARTIKGDLSPVVLAAVIDSARALVLRTHLETVIGHLAHAHWRVRRAAVRFVAAFDAPEAVKRLIEMLRDEGPLRTDVNEALITLTGIDKHGDYATWTDWWQSEGEAGLENRPPRSARVAALDAARRAPDTKVVFYGIPVVSRRVIFVVDVSGSMDEKSTWHPEQEVRRPIGDRKIDVARFELKRAVDRLPPEAVFNVVSFNTKLYWASDAMLSADGDSKRMAFDWIDAWKSEGGTNSHGALIRALEIAGVHHQRMAADTIYFISDGKPTLGTPEWILGKVREKNPHAKVIIHTIAVGENADRTFMEALAEENGGTYWER